MSARRAESFVHRASRDRAAAGFLLESETTAGLVSLLEFALEGWQPGPDLHLHAHSDEAFYVLDGELEMQVAEQRHILGPGDFAWVPRGVAHTFVNATERQARALTIAVPGGLENYFAEQAAYLAGLTGQPDNEELAEIRRRHGGLRLGPPIRPTATTQRHTPAP